MLTSFRCKEECLVRAFLSAEKVSSAPTHHTWDESVQDLSAPIPPEWWGSLWKVVRTGAPSWWDWCAVWVSTVAPPRLSHILEPGKESCATSFGLQGRAGDGGVPWGIRVDSGPPFRLPRRTLLRIVSQRISLYVALTFAVCGTKYFLTLIALSWEMWAGWAVITALYVIFFLKFYYYYLYSSVFVYFQLLSTS